MDRRLKNIDTWMLEKKELEELINSDIISYLNEILLEKQTAILTGEEARILSDYNNMYDFDSCWNGFTCIGDYYITPKDGKVHVSKH